MMQPSVQCLAHRLQHEFPPSLDKGARLLYVTKHPREAVMAPDYFLSAADRLRRADIIRVIIDCGDFDATCELVVARADREHVVVEEWSPWRQVPGSNPPSEAASVSQPKSPSPEQPAAESLPPGKSKLKVAA